MYKPMKSDFKVSVIVPCFNEENNINPLFESVSKYTKGLVTEILFVDDGSSDKTLDNIKILTNQHKNVKFLSFSRNFGHQNALKAGYDSADGDCVISMDADMQHPPELIPEMIRLWQQGYKIVSTKRMHDKSLGFLKRLTSKLFYKIINLVSEIKIESGAADFRLLDKQVVTELKEINEKFLFFRGLIPWLGFSQIQLEYIAAERFSGKTKYSFSKMLHFASDGITSFSVKPLKISIYLGFIIAFIAFLYILYAIYIAVFTNNAIAGWTSTIISVLFIGGIQLIMIGILGNYLGKLFMENKKRPNYIIKEKND
ncbi:MAG: glycosyltransferase family 2 protein [Bacteroidales bacterium]|nr:glycosyltransferase family 2 protein [Bacteroidales bacterium]